MKKMVLSLLVDNTSGVLSRVSGMFSRRGYNIDSLTVGVTENPQYSRMTVAVSGDDRILSQIKKQLLKLEDVISITELKDGESVCRELILVKVAVKPEVTLGEYKGIEVPKTETEVTDEDVDAVKKLAVIIKMASMMNITNSNAIKEEKSVIYCFIHNNRVSAVFPLLNSS